MKVGVIGAGTMGSGIAQAFAQTEGYEVCLCDINEEFAANGKAKIAKGLEKRVARGKMEQAAADAILAKITTGVKDICTDCDLIVEAAIENMEIKKQTQIFVTVSYYFRMQEYRKKLLMSKQISDDIKQFSYEICQKHKVIIRYMETDKDHIHYMIETEPTMSISKIVNLMKSYTTYHIWKRYPDYLRKHFWKEHTFWTDGYFVCSVGNVSEEMLRKYIENQG